MSRIWKEARALAAFLRSRAFALGMLSVVLAFVIFQISTMTNVVYVTDEEGSELHYTMEIPEKFLKPMRASWTRNRLGIVDFPDTTRS